MRIAISAKTRTRPDRPASIDNCRCSRNQSIAPSGRVCTLRAFPPSPAVYPAAHIARRLLFAHFDHILRCRLLGGIQTFAPLALQTPLCYAARQQFKPPDRQTHSPTYADEIGGWVLRQPHERLPSVCYRTCAVQPRTAIPVSSDSAVESLQGLLRPHTAIKDDAHPATVAVSLSGHTATDRPLKGIGTVMSSSMATKPNSLRTKSWLDIQSTAADQVPITSCACAGLWDGLSMPNMALVLVSSRVHILQKRITYASPVSQLATSAPGLEASTVRLTLGLGGPGWGGGASCSEREAFSVA
ncbi:hypothetical protein CPAR01_13343 [Colletotrichum paranaense]|uniref:Uncharacterized protein n=1 Tax=Colletotrichum paranaense TaxID=1914294 RepID=A0ABQ9S5U8_9PEZI|nr:uncharacterized protein CPAR01_13343 [Colletotrichum paranaense]KAK1526815.1 hypothetical protein CPAR01_13343 [Colletotrichum paranaense]